MERWQMFTILTSPVLVYYPNTVVDDLPVAGALSHITAIALVTVALAPFLCTAECVFVGFQSYEPSDGSRQLWDSRTPRHC